MFRPWQSSLRLFRMEGIGTPVEDCFALRTAMTEIGLAHPREQKSEIMSIGCLEYRPIATPLRRTLTVAIAREVFFPDRGNLPPAGLFCMEGITPIMIEDCFTPPGFAMTYEHGMEKNNSERNFPGIRWVEADGVHIGKGKGIISVCFNRAWDWHTCGSSNRK